MGVETCQLENGDYCKAIQQCFFRAEHRYQAEKGGENPDNPKDVGGIFSEGAWSAFGRKSVAMAKETGCAEVPELEKEVVIMYQHKKDTDELKPDSNYSPFVPPSFALDTP